MTYYIVNRDTRALVRESSTPFNIDESVQPDPPLIQLKRVDDDTRPAFDPATQKLVRIFTDNDAAFTRTWSWQVQAKTQAEMDAYQLEQQDAATLVIIRNVYQDLKNGVGTAVQRLERCERALAWLLRQHVRNGQ
jgi:hypothetical protein